MPKDTEFKKYLALYKRSLEVVHRLKDFQLNYDPHTQHSEAKVRLEILDSTYEKFCDCSCMLEVAIEGKEIEGIDLTKDMVQFEENYCMLKSFLTSAISNSNGGPESNVRSAIRSVKLPDITLPEFSGNSLHWCSFYDTFNSLVHNNQDLTDVQRFHYLRSTLRGEALKLIDKISVTNDNYSVALKIVIERYENKNILIRNHIEALFKIEKVNKESPKALTNLVGEFENNLGILEKLGENVTKWSSLLVYMLSSRIDQTTFREWQRVAHKHRMPTYSELLSFLRSYITELESLQAGRPANVSKQITYTNTVTSSGADKICPFCKGSHKLYFCEKFKHLPYQKRVSTVAYLNVCANCLSGKHPAFSCKYGCCRECKLKHHTLLNDYRRDKPPAVTNIIAEIPSVLPNNNSNLFNPPSQSTSNTMTSNSDHQLRKQIFLATAIVKVFGPK